MGGQDIDDDVLWTAFRSFDKDGDGMIQVNELASILEEQVQSLNGRQRSCNALAKNLIKTYNQHNKDFQTLSFEDFKDIFKSLHAAHASEDLCTNNNNGITSSEFLVGNKSTDPYSYLRQSSGLNPISFNN